jgi:uncharacterized damage-inducible protein DinB
MKETLLHFAGFNEWANGRITEAMLAMPSENHLKAVVSSFPTLQETIVHTWGAEDIWLQRLELAERPDWKPASFKGDLPEACAAWKKASASLTEFIRRQYTDKALEHVVEYRKMDGQVYKSAVYAVLMHVFNHSTYHRGQLVTMMRNLGATKIPGTDFIAYKHA